MPSKRVTKLMIAICVTVAALTACSPTAVQDPVPSQIEKLTMGADMASVKEMINGSGDFVTGVPRDKRGSEIVWTPTGSPYYQTIDFDFTEKDRLYIIRYNLKEASREAYHGVKQGFFNLYKFDPDDTGPSRMKLGGNDALVYDHPKHSNTYFFEITDKKTGNKSIELLERSMSAQDRPKKPEQSPQAAGEQPQAPKEPANAEPDKAPEKVSGPAPDKASEPGQK